MYTIYQRKGQPYQLSQDNGDDNVS